MKVEFLVLPNGRCPVEEFLMSLEQASIAKVYRLIELLKEDGTLPFPHARKMQGYKNLWELRIMSKGNAVRIFYVYAGKERVVLISGFMKKSRKTPERELDRAMNLLKIGGIIL